MLARDYGVIAGIYRGGKNVPAYEIVIEKCEPRTFVHVGDWIWNPSGKYCLYAFYERKRHSGIQHVEDMLVTPELYEDVECRFDEHLRGLFDDWAPLNDIIVANLPQPIAEEIVLDVSPCET